MGLVVPKRVKYRTVYEYWKCLNYHKRNQKCDAQTIDWILALLWDQSSIKNMFMHDSMEKKKKKDDDEKEHVVELSKELQKIKHTSSKS